MFYINLFYHFFEISPLCFWVWWPSAPALEAVYSCCGNLWFLLGDMFIWHWSTRHLGLLPDCRLQFAVHWWLCGLIKRVVGPGVCLGFWSQTATEAIYHGPISFSRAWLRCGQKDFCLSQGQDWGTERIVVLVQSHSLKFVLPELVQWWI